jgi:nitrite reductase/ring-hydroxylating ferredoxin subunit
MMRIDASDLPLDSVRAVSDDLCLVRTAAGVFATARWCPHAGGDLANGYVLGGKLRCAFHNLPYDPATGSQPCARLPRLRVYPLTEVGQGVYELDPGG